MERDFWSRRWGLHRFRFDQDMFGHPYRAAFPQILMLTSSCCNWRCAQPLDGCQNTVEQIATDGNFSELEGNGASVPDNSGTNLD